MKSQNIQYEITPGLNRDIHFLNYLEGMFVKYFCLHPGICGDTSSEPQGEREHPNGFMNYGGCIFLNREWTTNKSGTNTLFSPASALIL
jgi:hypothetical protein